MIFKENRMIKKGWILIFGFVLFLTGCVTFDVRIDYDPSFNFSRYKAFQFTARQRQPSAKTRDTSFIRDPFFTKAVEQEIGAVLSEKGYRMAASPRTADFLISYYAVARNQTAIAPTTYGVGRHGAHRVSRGRVYRYRQGTLVIDIIDSAQRELVWRGIGSGVLDRMNPTKNLLLAVERILKAFPPR